MRIVNLELLLQCPKGTVFSRYMPIVSEGLYQFHSAISDCDFWCAPLIGTEATSYKGTEAQHAAFAAAENDPHVDLSYATTALERWGSYDPSDQFLIYTEDNVREMIAALQKALPANVGVGC